MAVNLAASYGRDIACLRDSDDLFTEAVGLDVVRQDAFHRITTDNVLGDDGTGSLVIVGWGFDVRRLVGMNASKLAAHQPILSSVLTRDPRIDHADVTLTPTTTRGLADVQVRAVCTTALGTFPLVIKSVVDLDPADLVGQV